VAAAAKKDKAKAALPSFKQYREDDGRFYFKFVDAQGRLLLQSTGFASPKEAGQFIAQLKQSASAQQLHGLAAPAEGVALDEINTALRSLAEL
jgi:tryptophanyl-tRNA synthetase